MLIAVVMLLVLVGVPVLMHGMGGATFCHQCGPAVAVSQACGLAAVLTGIVLLSAVFGLWLRSRRHLIRELLLVVAFDRPPRLV